MRVIVLEAGQAEGRRPGVHLAANPRLGFASGERSRLTRGLLFSIGVAPGRSGFGRGAILSVGTGAGGAGILWSGICERLDTPTPEGRHFVESCAQGAYADAERRFRVVDSIERERLAGLAGMRPIRTATSGGRGPRKVPGPNKLLRSTAGLDVRRNRLALRLVHRSGRAEAVEAVNSGTGEVERYWGDTVVVAADAIRSPALLVASGLAPEPGFPVGRWLADHPLAVARVAAATPEGRALAHALAPKAGETICSGVILESGARGATRLVVAIPDDDPGARTLMLYWYAVGRPSSANRLLFPGRAGDDFGTNGALLRLDADLAEAEDLRTLMEDLTATTQRLGTPLRGWKPRLLPAGSAHHTFGTLRTTLTRDEPGVTDAQGRVWGFQNLFVCGPARLPAPCATNPALVSVASSLLTVAAISGVQPAPEAPSPKSAVRRGLTV
jgi:choline dehydrogenase-like flavoprotein